MADGYVAAALVSGGSPQKSTMSEKITTWKVHDVVLNAPLEVHWLDSGECPKKICGRLLGAQSILFCNYMITN